MKELFVNSIFNFIDKNKKLDHYNQVKIKYGLEVLYHFITKTFAILIISYFLGTLKEVILIFALYGLLRTYIHGIHAKSNIGCWISTIIIYVAASFLIKITSFNMLSKFLLCLLCFVSFLFWSPSDTKYRPLINKKVRYKLKIKSIIILTIYTFLIFFLNNSNVINCIMFSIALSAITINPITYKITNNSYMNYKNYNGLN